MPQGQNALTGLTAVENQGSASKSGGDTCRSLRPRFVGSVAQRIRGVLYRLTSTIPELGISGPIKQWRVANRDEEGMPDFSMVITL